MAGWRFQASTRSHVKQFHQKVHVDVLNVALDDSFEEQRCSVHQLAHRLGFSNCSKASAQGRLLCVTRLRAPEPAPAPRNRWQRRAQGPCEAVSLGAGEVKAPLCLVWLRDDMRLQAGRASEGLRGKRGRTTAPCCAPATSAPWSRSSSRTWRGTSIHSQPAGA